MDTLSEIKTSTLTFTEFCEASSCTAAQASAAAKCKHVAPSLQSGTIVARKLRAAGADIVIALTHMRSHNDRKLAASVPEIDLVLGGHDHGGRVASEGRCAPPVLKA